MTDQQWQAVWQLYQTCCSVSPEKLRETLDESRDDEVREAVLAMLGTMAVENLDLVGQRIGRYVLTACLGEGGMGEVYAAKDAELGRSVAVKLLARPAGGEAPAVARFIREAKAASALNHPNIVTIYEVVHSESRFAIVMELVDGVSLRELCGSRQPVDRMLHLGAQVARALAAAHKQGIVHCDIKPENIMVREDGVVKVLDFGLAQDLLSKESSSILPAGTLRYMPPEQLRGEAISTASDVFCLGIVLYEMATGTHPFERGSIFDTMRAVNESVPRAPSGVNPYAPTQLDALILRMLAKEPARRPGAAEVARVLESGFSSRKLSIEAPASAPTRRWRMGIAAAALGLAVAGGAYWWHRDRGPETAFVAKRLTTLPGSEEGPSLSPDGLQVAFRGNQAQQWDIYVKLIGGGGPVRLTTDKGTHGDPAWSPDGDRIAFTASHEDGRNGLFVMPALGGGERLLEEMEGAPATVDWSPDGKWIAVSPAGGAEYDSAYGVTLVSAQTGERRDLVEQDAQMGESAFGRFSPDGRRLAFLRMRGAFGRLYVVKLTSDMRLKGTPRAITPEDMEVQFPAWTADGRDIVFMRGFATSDGALARVSADGGAVRRIPGLGYAAGPISIARRGGRMAYSSGGIDSNMWRLDTKGVEAARPLAVSTVADIAGEYSPDGKRIIFSSNRSGAREIWVCDADGQNAVQLTHIGGPITGTPRWSPDGRWIAFDSRPRGEPDVFVMSPEGTGLRRVTDPAREAVKTNRWGMWQPAWSADGKWIYFSSERTGRFEIWRIPWVGGKAEQVTRDGGSAAYPSRDGEWIYYVDGEPGPLRRIRPDGSGEETVAPEVRFLEFTSIARGTYFVVSSGRRSKLERLAENGKAADVMRIPFVPWMGLSLSPNGRYALVTRPDERGTDLMLVEGFR